MITTTATWIYWIDQRAAGWRVLKTLTEGGKTLDHVICVGCTRAGAEATLERLKAIDPSPAPIGIPPHHEAKVYSRWDETY